MTTDDVKQVLAHLHLKATQTPHGFEFRDGCLLERGTKATGELKLWFFMKRTRLGYDVPIRTSSKRELRRVLLEWMAGPRPPDIEGYHYYAKRHRNRFGDSVIWCCRPGDRER